MLLCVFPLYHIVGVRVYGFVRSCGAFACFLLKLLLWCARLVSCSPVGAWVRVCRVSVSLGSVVDCGWFSCGREG